MATDTASPSKTAEKGTTNDVHSFTATHFQAYVPTLELWMWVNKATYTKAKKEGMKVRVLYSKSE